MPNSHPHPTYRNPTIVEAVCEIHFRLPEDQPWKAALAGRFYTAIQPDFPNMEPILDVGVELGVDRTNVRQTVRSPRQRIRFEHASRPLILQLSESTFTVNVTPPYPGWESVRSDLLRSWAKAREVLHASAITRLGLRYINRLPRESPEDRPEKWLRPNPYLATAVLGSRPGFLSRVQVQQDAENRIIVTLGEHAGARESGPGAVIFDIDRIAERELPPSDDPLATEMERLHNDVWDVFVSAKGEGLERLLSGAE